jgi:Flp pilus assembly protein TadG
LISEHGAGTVLALFMVVVVAVAGIGTAGVGALFAERERVTTAAEAAALAAAVATYPPAAPQRPRRAAAELAIDNGARLDVCVCSSDPSLQPRTVLVGVSSTVDLPLFGEIRVSGRARAEFDPGKWLAG